MNPTSDELRGLAQSVIRTVTLWQANNSFVVQDKVAEVIQDFLSHEEASDCDNIQCKQLHEYLDSLLDLYGLDKSGYAVNKAARLQAHWSELERNLKEAQILERERNETANVFMAQVKRLQAELEEWKVICRNRDATVNQQGEEWVKLKTEIDRLRQALGGIANMPSYDQDDAHRLRNIAKQALDLNPR